MMGRLPVNELYLVDRRASFESSKAKKIITCNVIAITQCDKISKNIQNPIRKSL